MKYRVVFSSSAIERHFKRELEKIAADKQDEIMDAVLALSENQRPQGVLKIKPAVAIFHSLAQYRFRIGDHRVFYDIDERRKLVLVIALRRRNESTYR